MKVEVDKLLSIEFIKKVDYPQWVANIVMVKKATRVDKLTKRCMCTDYTDLNKACSNENFPLHCINRLVDATMDHDLLTFLDAFSRYN